jgi:hypothetical protein
MSGTVTAALRQVGKAVAEGKNVETYLAQGDLIETDPDKNRPAVQSLALTFANATQKEVKARFELMAQEAERSVKGQGLLVSMPENKPAPSFIKAFLSPLVYVDGKSIADFNPKGNETHAALQYAYDNGGKTHSVNTALEKLHKIAVNKKATMEQKAEAKETIRKLADYPGKVEVYPPKMGSFFKYRNEEELFQSVPDAVGAIDTETAAMIGMRPGIFSLEDDALEHIEQNHGEQIRQLGYADAREFVNYVLSHVDAIYQGESRRVVEIVTRDTRPQSRVLARLEFELSGDKYEIKTAEPVRSNYYKKRTPLWDRSHAHPSAETDPIKASRRGSPGQSGEQLDFTAAAREVKQGNR